MIRINIVNNVLCRERYSTYVLKHENSRFTHLLEWSRVIEKSFGFKQVTLIAQKRDEVVGVLPLFGGHSLVKGKYFCSAPIPTYGGPLVSSGEALTELLGAAIRMGEGLKYVNIYSGCSLGIELDKWPKSHVSKRDKTYLLTFNSSINQTFRGLKKNIRRDIRRSEKFGLIAETVNSINKLKIDKFYKLYCRVYCKKHGLIPHRKRFFENMIACMPSGSVVIYFAYYYGKEIAAIFTIQFNKEIYYCYSAHDSQFNKLQPITFLIWKIIEEGHENGCEMLNMGESSRLNEGLTRFKQRWCSTSHTAYSYFFMEKAKKVPVSFSDGYGFYKKVIKAIPLFITQNTLSPLIKFIM